MECFGLYLSASAHRRSLENRDHMNEGTKEGMPTFPPLALAGQGRHRLGDPGVKVKQDAKFGAYSVLNCSSTKENSVGSQEGDTGPKPHRSGQRQNKPRFPGS